MAGPTRRTHSSRDSRPGNPPIGAHLPDGGARQTTVRPQSPETHPGDEPAGRGDSPLPERFGPYRVLRKLGAGGMGSVYLAEDTRLDRRVALEVPHFSQGKSEHVLARFYREARAAATLQHPNLCPVYEVGEIDIDRAGLQRQVRPISTHKRDPFSQPVPDVFVFQGRHARKVIRRGDACVRGAPRNVPPLV